MVIFSLRHFALNCVIIWIWSNYPLYFFSIFKKLNLDGNIYTDTTYCQMLVHGKSSNCSRQIILWSASGKCHFVQCYETLAGSRNIKNINSAHISPTAKLSALEYFDCALIIFFSGWEGRTHWQTLHMVKISGYNCMHCQKTISAELIFLGPRKQEKVIQVS